MGDKRVTIKWQRSKDETAWIMKRGSKHLGVAWNGQNGSGWFQFTKETDAKMHGPFKNLEEAMQAAEKKAAELGFLA